MYDIIGDIHGEAATLIQLLRELGYKNVQGVYSHANRQVIFLGDFVDRGRGQREVVDIARAMVEAGNALAVMGNHEFNAIAYATPKPGGGHLREHNEKNCRQHRAFLAAYENDAVAYSEAIAWFKTLPLWLELDGLRVIHACWDFQALANIAREYATAPTMTDALLHAASDPATWQFNDVETLLKGKEVKLPDGVSFPDVGGTLRQHMRIKWWSQATTFREASMVAKDVVTHIPEEPLSSEHLVEYREHEKPLFLGHYWLSGEPKPLAPNIACLDYSVAKGGKLVAYQWDGEELLEERKFVAVERI